jgi:aspartyl aminopeptidase
VHHITKEKLDKTNPLQGGIAIRTGVKSDAPSVIVGEYWVARIAKAAGIELQVVSYGNDDVVPRSIAPVLVDATGIRAVEVGFAMIRHATVRGIASEKDIAALVTLLRAAYEYEGEANNE